MSHFSEVRSQWEVRTVLDSGGISVLYRDNEQEAEFLAKVLRGEVRADELPPYYSYVKPLGGTIMSVIVREIPAEP